MVHVRGMVGVHAGVDGGGGARSGGVPRAGREDSWNMGLAMLAGGVPGMIQFPSEGVDGAEGAEGVDQALDVGQFGQPRLSAVDELRAREGGVALDFRMDNPLANARVAGAGAAVAVAVAVAGRPQSSTFGAAPIAPIMPPVMPPVAVASPAPAYGNAGRQVSLREDDSTEEYECDGGEDDLSGEEFEEKKGGEAGASHALSEGKSAAPVPVVMPVVVMQAPVVVVQADPVELITYDDAVLEY